MDGEAIIKLVQSAAGARTEEICQGPEQRKQLLAALRKLTTKLEDPNAAIVRFLFQVRPSRWPRRVESDECVYS